MEPNLGTRRTNTYPGKPKRGIGIWIAIAAAAVALVLFLGFGRKDVDRADAVRGTPAGLGRRPVDDRTVRPNDRPLPNNPDPAYDRNLQAPSEDTLQPLPNDGRGTTMPPSDDLPSRTDVPPAEVPAPEQVPSEQRMP